MVEALAEAGARVYIASRSEASYRDAVMKFVSSGLDVKGVELDQSDKKMYSMSSRGYRRKLRYDILINSGCERPMGNFIATLQKVGIGQWRSTREGPSWLAAHSVMRCPLSDGVA